MAEDVCVLSAASAYATMNPSRQITGIGGMRNDGEGVCDYAEWQCYCQAGAWDRRHTAGVTDGALGGRTVG